LFFGLIVKRIGLKQLGVPKNYKFPIQQRRTFSLTFLRMSDSEEDTSVPDALTAQKLCKEFEAVTNTDEIMAQMYLQENGWDLRNALNSYFATKCEKLEAEKAEEMTRSRSPGSDGGEAGTSLDSALRAGVLTTMAPKHLNLVTWNIDGLDQKNLKRRTRAVIETLLNMSADIVFLQEVIPETFSYIESKLTNYECIAAKQSDYFVATLLRRGRVYLDRHKVVDFPTTRMFRHVLAVQAHCGNVVMDLLNTHLESTAEHTDERMRQLEKCFDIMNRRPEDRTVILGGDLNMRDKEVASVGGLPAGARDVWEQLGSRPEVKWTWDLTRNTNLEWAGKWKPRCRFDRVYIRESESSNMRAEQFGLLGLEKVEGTQSFPSDHWGVRVGLKLSQ